MDAGNRVSADLSYMMRQILPIRVKSAYRRTRRFRLVRFLTGRVVKPAIFCK
jgi:hypothetical protein